MKKLTIVRLSFRQVIPNIYQVHMDPETWREPTKFQPERFLDKDGQLINKDRIIPFSIG
jgi:cytochrome P450